MEIKGKVHCFFEQSGTFTEIPYTEYDNIETILKNELNII